MSHDNDREARMDRHDDERALDQARLAADADLLEAAKGLRSVEVDGHWDDETWWQAMYRVRDIADRAREMETP